MGKKIFKVIGVLVLDLIIGCLDFGFIFAMCGGGACDEYGYWTDLWYIVAIYIIPVVVLALTLYLINMIFRKKK